jgi:gluconolactonase
VILETRDPRLRDLGAPDAPIDRIAGGLTFTGGSVWRGGALLFSDIPNKRIVRWRRLPEGPELTTYATGMSNGLTLDRQGLVLAAEHDGRRVTRVSDDGARSVLAERFQRKRLNSRVWVCRADGPLLGRIVLPELAANLAWGENEAVLFFTARPSVYRMPTKTGGTLLG